MPVLRPVISATWRMVMPCTPCAATSEKVVSTMRRRTSSSRGRATDRAALAGQGELDLASGAGLGGRRRRRLGGAGRRRLGGDPDVVARQEALAPRRAVGFVAPSRVVGRHRVGAYRAHPEGSAAPGLGRRRGGRPRRTAGWTTRPEPSGPPPCTSRAHRLHEGTHELPDPAPTAAQSPGRPAGATPGGRGGRPAPVTVSRRTVLAMAVGAALAAVASLVTWLVWDRFALLAAGAVALGWLAGWVLSGGAAESRADPWAGGDAWDPGPEPDGWPAAEPEG